MGLRPGAFSALAQAPGVRPPGTEAYDLSSLGSHLVGAISQDNTCIMGKASSPICQEAGGRRGWAL